MVLTRSRRRTATGIGTLVAFILVLVFGSPIFVDWVNNNTRADTAGGLFLRTLAWPAWSFDSHTAVRDLLAQDLKAILSPTDRALCRSEQLPLRAPCRRTPRTYAARNATTLKGISSLKLDSDPLGSPNPQ